MSGRFFLISLFLCCVVAKVDYKGFKVVDVFPSTREQAKTLHDLNPHEKPEKRSLDWQPQCVMGGQMCQAMVSPGLHDPFVAFLKLKGIRYEEHSLDLQQEIDQEQRRIQKYRISQARSRGTPRSASRQGNSWDLDFHTYDETLIWLNNIVNSHPTISSLINFGSSFEGRQMLGIRLGLNSAAPKFFFDGGIHAREWLSPATVEYIVNQLVDGHDRGDPEIISLLQNVEFHVLPIFNVDGFEYTWNTDRLWRKTRSFNQGSTCVGTDPNRNADAGFGGPGTSRNPCSDTYHGAAPFSEIEVANVAAYVVNQTNIHGYNNIHTNAQLLLSPYGYTNQLPADLADHNQIHNASAAAIRSVFGADYEFGPIYSTIYPAAGGINDYLYDQGVKYAVAWELRGGSFSPPASFIVTSGEEIFEGFKVFSKFIAAEFGSTKR